MRIEISTSGGEVTAAAVETQELILAKGKTLTEAIENLMRRFGELRDLTLQELRAREFIQPETSAEEMS